MHISEFFNRKIYFLLLISVSISFVSCDSCPDECGAGKISILGQCEDDQNMFLFAAYPNFYCYNDSIVVGFPKDHSINESKIYVSVFRYLEEKGSGTNWLSGGLRSSHVLKNEFYEQCKDKPEGNITYHTFLIIEDIEKITEGTSEIKGKLELRTSQYSAHHYPEVYPPKVVLDSAAIVLKRLR